MFLRALLFLSSFTLVLGFAGGVMFFFGKNPIAFVFGFVGGYFLLAVISALLKGNVDMPQKPFHHEPELTGYED